jgi:hypothetical protein
VAGITLTRPNPTATHPNNPGRGRRRRRARRRARRRRRSTRKMRRRRRRSTSECVIGPKGRVWQRVHRRSSQEEASLPVWAGAFAYSCLAYLLLSCRKEEKREKKEYKTKENKEGKKEYKKKEDKSEYKKKAEKKEKQEVGAGLQ